MYNPRHFAVEDPTAIVHALRLAGFGHLVTASEAGSPAFTATAIPFVVDDEMTSVRSHFATANPHWRHIDRQPALLIVPGPDAYISPRWYPSKKIDGKVVPTWNYEAVHLHGTVHVHHDLTWKLEMLNDLTSENEARVSDADSAPEWAVSDAPDDYIESRASAGIVGIELTVTAVEAKRKLSQNAPADNSAGAAAGLSHSLDTTDRAVAELMHDANGR